MRALNKLTNAEVKAAEVGKHGDGGGLWLWRREDGGAQWFLRFTLHGKRREMGLGPYPALSLKAAREAADNARALVRQGIDPIIQREQQARSDKRNLRTLSAIALDCFEARKADLKGDGKAGRWFSPLELHVLPKLGHFPVGEIDQTLIRDTLSPIWHKKAETARKASNRLGLCLKHAAALGLDVDLQAVEKAKALLGKQRHEIKHVPSMPWQEVPAFYESLSEGTVTHLAMRLLILTGLRSKPIRFCRLEEIEGDVWTVPAENMKGLAGRTSDFRVPLSKEALRMIKKASAFERDGYLFPSVRRGVISDATMSRMMERREMEARPHGFRTSLRVWLAECTDAPHEVAETCLAHTVGGSVERAYRRTDFIEQRQVLMDRWAEYCRGSSGGVVQFARQ